MMLTQASLDRLADAVIAAMKIGQAAMQQRLASLEVTNTRLEERVVQLERRLQQAAIQ